jgi:hypothetical protein
VNKKDQITFTRLAGTFRAVSARQHAILSDLTEGQARRDLERKRAGGWLVRLPTWELVPAGYFALTAPLAVHERGGPMPDLRTVARELAARRMRPRRPGMAYRATAKAINLVGGVSPDCSKPGQAFHDLAIVDMYIAATRSRPGLAAAWFGEDEIRRVLTGSDSFPDALVVGSNDSLRAFELGGAYDVQRLEKFHLGCEQLGIPEWEIW